MIKVRKTDRFGTLMKSSENIYDIVVIGGGVNGCGIARDAAGRGLRVLLCEKDDLAQATSSASTKLFHGGLRYLEYFEFRLVRKALAEREILLRNMPHIARPMRFVLPHDPELRFTKDPTSLGKFLKYALPFLRGRRPAWLIRLGLFLYDNLGGRKILPPTQVLNLKEHATGHPLKQRFTKAFEYSDCWVDDARLVVLNAQDAAHKGCEVRTRTKCISATRSKGYWNLKLQASNGTESHLVRSKAIVNAGGPWVEEILKGNLAQDSNSKIRLVRGSHIVVNKLFDHNQPYFFQLPDNRIIFAIPYEKDFTLIGTTDQDHSDTPEMAFCTREERDYLLNAANLYFRTEISDADIVWTYSGVRPLYDDGAKNAASATRDYVLTLDEQEGALPVLSVFGGKITTYRKLAEDALEQLARYFPDISQGAWTMNAPLPGGDFQTDQFDNLVAQIQARFPDLSPAVTTRLTRAYGTQIDEVFKDGPGAEIAKGVYHAELKWLVTKEWARTSEDVLWRRSKLGLILSKEDQNKIAATLEKLVQEHKAKQNDTIDD